MLHQLGGTPLQPPPQLAPLTFACRAALFICLATSGFAPILQVGLREGRLGLQRFPLANIAVTCLSYLIGTCLYVVRFPEKTWPDTFDVWVCSPFPDHTLVDLTIDL